MRNKYLSIQSGFTILLIGLVLFSSCRKTSVSTSAENNQVPTTGTRIQLSEDSIFLYAKQIYYWNTSLPDYKTFNPRQYNNTQLSDEENYYREIFAITRYAVNPSTGKSYEYDTTYPNETKYSYISNLADQNPSAYVPSRKSSVDLEGNGYDLGLKIGVYTTTSPAYNLYIQAVYQNSPADKAGLMRGDKITKINGTSIGTNFNNELNTLNTIFDAGSATLDGIKADGTSFSVTLNKVSYKSSPIYKSKILNFGGKKIGYLAYARFSNLTNSQSDFNSIFTDFSTNNVTDLIIDLRYNGGGYVSTAEYLINLIAPIASNGKVMFTEYYNNTMATGQASILSHQPLIDANEKLIYSNGKVVTYADVSFTKADNTYQIEKKGSLNNVANVVFIVSGNTASASELVINSLKPYVNVKLVGTTTYGKPVGFFPIRIENKYEVYFSMFESRNAKGEGGYYSGITPDVTVSDDVTHDFGDPAEKRIAAALNIIVPGVNVVANSKIMSTNQKAVNQNLVQKVSMGGNEFTGMIKTKFHSTK